MTNKLQFLLNNLKLEIDNWNNGLVSSEDVFIISLREIIKKVADELAEPQGPPIVKK